jgi:glycosyltransferase involved in cell wall biosynthesis
MRILMLAPEPFFAERGTPLSILSRLKALSQSRHAVDLVCYPHGAAAALPGLRIVRPARPFWIRSVPIGFSLRKVRLDFGLAATALRLCLRHDYDLIFTHEEAVLLGVLLRRLTGVPHLYDMHSSLPDNLVNQGRLRVGGWAYQTARSVEEWYLRRTDGVLTICDSLSNRAREAVRENRPIRMVENIPVDELVPPCGDLNGQQIRHRCGIAPEAPLCVYTGNAAPVQGLGLLVDAFRLWRKTHPRARLLLVGTGRFARCSAAEGILSLEPHPASEMSAFMAAADVLASPRACGENVPLKIYSYLKSRRPIVATDIAAHNPLRGVAGAMLVPPEPHRFADALAQSAALARVAPPTASADPVFSTNNARPLPSLNELREALESLFRSVPGLPA